MDDKPLQVNVRMPAELKKRLEDEAWRSGRSLTAEVVTRLEQSFIDTEAETLRMGLESGELLGRQAVRIGQLESELEELRRRQAGNVEDPKGGLAEIMEKLSEQDRLLSALTAAIESKNGAMARTAVRRISVSGSGI